jgi:hypothetical protein
MELLGERYDGLTELQPKVGTSSGWTLHNVSQAGIRIDPHAQYSEINELISSNR